MTRGLSRFVVSVAVVAVAGIAAGCGSNETAEISATDTESVTIEATEPAETTQAEQSPDEQEASEAETEPTAVEVDENVPDLPDRGPNPGLVELDGWINAGDVTSLDDLKGQVVAVQFWTFACSNCKATLPHVTELTEKYGDQGFTVVGVHSPEFDFEADPNNIEEAIAEQGVTWPVALDTSKKNFHGWQEGTRSFWPRIYLLDRNGNIRYDHIGEGRYDEIDAAVGALLAEDT